MRPTQLRGALVLHAIVALQLVGCVTLNVEEDYQPNSKEGLLVFSFSYTPLESEPSWFFRRINQESKRVIVSGNFWENLDWEAPPGRLVFTALPPGEYEFVSVRYITGYRTRVETHWRVNKDGIVTPYYVSTADPITDEQAFRAPFRITPGKAVYLGSFRFASDAAVGNWPVTMTRPIITIEDRSERDIPLLLQRLPALQRKDVLLSVSQSVD